MGRKKLDALRRASTRSESKGAKLVSGAIRKDDPGPVAIWDGEPKYISLEYDSVYDKP